jgi:hypothetical protein
MSNRGILVMASLVGALVVHATMTACSNDSAGSTGTKKAHAQTPPAATPCTKWEVQGFLPTAFNFKSVNGTNPNGTPNPYSLPTFDAFALPDGWEPIGGGDLGAVIARHCLAP